MNSNLWLLHTVSKMSFLSENEESSRSNFVTKIGFFTQCVVWILALLSTFFKLGKLMTAASSGYFHCRLSFFVTHQWLNRWNSRRVNLATKKSENVLLISNRENSASFHVFL